MLSTLTLCLDSFTAAESTIYQFGGIRNNFTVITYDDHTLTLSEIIKEKDAVLLNISAPDAPVSTSPPSWRKATRSLLTMLKLSPCPAIPPTLMMSWNTLLPRWIRPSTLSRYCGPVHPVRRFRYPHISCCGLLWQHPFPGRRRSARRWFLHPPV